MSLVPHIGITCDVTSRDVTWVMPVMNTAIEKPRMNKEMWQMIERNRLIGLTRQCGERLICKIIQSG